MKVAILTTDNRDHFKDYTCQTPYFGTAPEALLQGFEALSDLEVHVISCHRQPMKSPAQIGAHIYFHGLHVPKWGWIRTGYQGCIRGIRAKLREIQPDIVHGQGSERECAVGAVFSGFRNVLTIHGNMVNMARVLRSRIGSYMWLAARLETLALRRTSGVLCNSQHTERAVQPRARRTWRVANPVRREFFASRPPGITPGKQIVNIGVISAYKRQIELLEMLMRLRQEGASLQAAFAGQSHPGSPYAIQFMEKIRPQSAWARYVGEKPASKLIELIDESAALIHVPVEESFGLVVAEALARGLKFFGFRVGGVPDIADSAPGAELLESGDWLSLGRAVSRWIAGGAQRYPEASKLMQARYCPDVIARRHLEIYREVLNT